MSHNIFFISDTHFGHSNILTFTDDNDNLIRPGFHNIEHMNEHIIERWNSVVKPQDKVYHLGDFAFGQQTCHKVLPRLNGHKRLVRGNHDVYEIRKTYLISGGFEEVYGVRMLPEYGIMMTHVPVHPQNLAGRWKVNVHGHLHVNHIKLPDSKPDKRYINVSVEQINYTPVHIDDVKKLIDKL